MEKIVTPTPTPLLQLYRHYLACRSVCTDTRALTPGCLFFALRGETFNANLFATQALEKGAAYAVVDDPNVAAQDARMCYVPNVLTALQELAAYHRKQLGIPIFALTGTNGKTTTKELIHAALATTYRVTATQGNLNNHIGVPLTLLRMDAATEIGVVEMGANHIEEIAQLVAIAQPTAGLITNVGMAHLEGFGSLEGVMQCKGALYDYLKAHGGTILVDASNSLLTAMLHARSITNARPYPAVVPTPATIKAPTLVVEVPQVGQITTQLVGTYNAPNVGAALAAAELYHIPLEVAAQAIAAYIPTNHRSQ